LGTYREALGELPPRRSDISGAKGKGKEKASEAEHTITEGEGQESSQVAEKSTTSENTGTDSGCEEEEQEVSTLRAVLSANVAASLLKLVSLFCSFIALHA